MLRGQDAVGGCALWAALRVRFAAGAKALAHRSHERATRSPGIRSEARRRVSARWDFGAEQCGAPYENELSEEEERTLDPGRVQPAFA